MTVRIGVTGATGRMGREVRARAAERGDVTVVFATTRADDEFDPEGDFSSLLAEHEPHVVVDFTAPEASAEYLTACADAGVAVVVGTTGFDEEGARALDGAAERIPVLHAANFSRGIRGLLDAVSAAVADLSDYDIEVTETHHSGKRDAPSGTANAVLDRIESVRGESERVHGREGDAPREPGEIGVHARRAGGIHGEHEVLLAGNDEVLSLTHRAESRGVFAAGALDAAVWLSGREPGRYEFGEVLEVEG